MHPDGLVDFVPEAIADSQVFRSEPRAHTGCLKVGMETICKFLILGGVADEARIRLNRLADERTNIRNQGVGHARGLKETLGYPPAGSIDRIYADSRWTKMLYGFQSGDHLKIDVCKYGETASRIGEIRFLKICSAEARPAKVHPAENRPPEFRVVEVR